jgi:hypothetical protein
MKKISGQHGGRPRVIASLGGINKTEHRDVPAFFLKIRPSHNRGQLRGLPLRKKLFDEGEGRRRQKNRLVLIS